MPNAASQAESDNCLDLPTMPLKEQGPTDGLLDAIDQELNTVIIGGEGFQIGNIATDTIRHVIAGNCALQQRGEEILKKKQQKP